jgi:hypothetical protein
VYLQERMIFFALSRNVKLKRGSGFRAD